jgi:hypothetical protein
MNAVLSPLVSEFETEDQQASHAAWLNAKIQACLSDARPNIPHDQVITQARLLLESRKKISAAN